MVNETIYVTEQLDGASCSIDFSLVSVWEQCTLVVCSQETLFLRGMAGAVHSGGQIGALKPECLGKEEVLKGIPRREHGIHIVLEA